jgi:hypothetical protein
MRIELSTEASVVEFIEIIVRGDIDGDASLKPLKPNPFMNYLSENIMKTIFTCRLESVLCIFFCMFFSFQRQKHYLTHFPLMTTFFVL